MNDSTMTVYLLWKYFLFDNGDVNVEIDGELLGVYSSLQNAQKAARVLPHIKKTDIGVSRYEVDGQCEGEILWWLSWERW